MSQSQSSGRVRTGAAGGRGLTTAEYALGTAAVVTGVAVLVAVFADPTAPVRIFWPAIERLIGVILHMVGLR